MQKKRLTELTENVINIRRAEEEEVDPEAERALSHDDQESVILLVLLMFSRHQC